MKVITTLVRLPKTQAAMATTSSAQEVEWIELRRQGGDEHAGQAGQDARQDPRHQRHRSELIPWSCTSRGLSTTARMRRPETPPRKSIVRATTTITVEMSVAIWPASRT